jgi:ABC-type polysaccharide/polyol phosphate export permease
MLTVTCEGRFSRRISSTQRFTPLGRAWLTVRRLYVHPLITITMVGYISGISLGIIRIYVHRDRFTLFAFAGITIMVFVVSATGNISEFSLG